MTIADESPDASEPIGLRERKKQRTRQAIVDAAMRLFAQRGFEATTIAEVAAAADIAPRTFFGYFPSKEAVVFHEHDVMLADFAARLRARSADESAFDAMRAWLLALLPTLEREVDRHAAHRCLIEQTPTLAAAAHANLAQFESVLARAIADDLGVPASALAPRLAAAAAIAALDAIERFRVRSEQPLDEAAVTALLDEALAFLRGGVGALRGYQPRG